MPRKNVGFVKPPEPSFITRMKQEAGYKEGPTVDTKREQLDPDDFDDRDDDDAPTVVVLRKGDLTAEEVEKERANISDSHKEEDTGGRIIFRKPVKRDSSGEPTSGEACAESSSKCSNKDGSSSKRSSKDKKRGKQQNTKLLSFQQDDDEEDED